MKPGARCFEITTSTKNISLLLTEREGRTAEYCPEVVAVRTKRSEVRTKTTEGNIYILLTKSEGRTGRISTRGLDSTDQAQRGSYKKDRGPIFSQYGSEHAWLIRDLLRYWRKQRLQRHKCGIIRDNARSNTLRIYIGPAIEHFHWSILVIGRLTPWVV